MKLSFLNFFKFFHFLKKKKKYSDIKVIKKSKYFNRRWYLKTYPDVKEAKINPAKHYLEYGWKEGRNPSKKFNSNEYLSHYDDVKRANINPLLHYERHGKEEGRIIHFNPNKLLMKIIKTIKKILPSTKKTKILLISHEMTYTGAPLSLLQAAKCFKDKGFKVSVISLREGELAREFNNLGIKVKLISNQQITRLLTTSLGHDIAIVNTLVPYLQYDILSHVMPTIWWVRENPILLKKNKEMHRIFSSGTNIYVMSDYSRKEFLPYNRNIKVIKHGMEDLYNQVSAPTKKIRFAVIGTISPRKGQDILIESIKKLKKEYLDKSEFYVIGKSLDAAIYNKVLEAQKTFPNIVVMDEIKQTTDMLKYYESVTCVIVTSRNEPTSRVTIEAMMMGRPVIMSSHVGAQYLLDEGQNGYMFESENSDELAKKISLFIDNITNIDAMSECARQAYLANNSMKVLSENLEKMIKNIETQHELKSDAKKHVNLKGIKITTIITSFNHKKYIKKAIESAIMQIGEFDYEILISDDGSTDGCQKIISKYAQKYPHLIINISKRNNVGISENMKRCFSAASGKYIAVLEGDDYWIDKRKLEKQVAFLEQNKDCSMCFSRIKLLDSQGRFRLLKRQDNISNKLSGKDFIRNPSLIVNFSSCLFKRDILVKLPEVLYEGRLSEISLAFYLDNFGKIGFISTPMSVYRQHEKGVWSGADKKKQLLQALQCRKTAYAVCRNKYKKKLKKIINKEYIVPLEIMNR